MKVDKKINVKYGNLGFTLTMGKVKSNKGVLFWCHFVKKIVNLEEIMVAIVTLQIWVHKRWVCQN